LKALRGLTQESSVIVTGKITPTNARRADFEIQITAIEVVAASSGRLSLSDSTQGTRR